MGLRAGWLNERVTLQRQTATPDGQGGSTLAWANLTTVPTVWAKVRQLSGTEGAEAAITKARARYEVTIRRRADVRASDRVLRGATILTIVAPPNDATDSPDMLVLTCESDGASV